MTVKIDVLRAAIAYCRAHPETYDQGTYYQEDKTCVIGRAAIMNGAIVRGSKPYRYIDTYPGGFGTATQFAIHYIGLNDEDRVYIAGGIRTLDEIEARVNEIAARENPPVMVKVRVGDTIHDIFESDLDAFAKGVKAVGGKAYRLTETEL